MKLEWGVLRECGCGCGTRLEAAGHEHVDGDAHGDGDEGDDEEVQGPRLFALRVGERGALVLPQPVGEVGQHGQGGKLLAQVRAVAWWVEQVSGEYKESHFRPKMLVGAGEG